MSEYRPNVAALVVDGKGKLLVCERIKFPGAWQFPQGGVDQGENLEEALFREVREEIGLQPSQYRVESQKGNYRYKFPPQFKKKGKFKYVGQEQTYYLCRVNEETPVINVMQEPREFSQYQWIWPEEFQPEWLPRFKLEVYRAVMRDFFDVEL